MFKIGQVRSGKGQSRAGQEGQMKVRLGQVKPWSGHLRQFRIVHAIVMLCQGQLMSG